MTLIEMSHRTAGVIRGGSRSSMTVKDMRPLLVLLVLLITARSAVGSPGVLGRAGSCAGPVRGRSANADRRRDGKRQPNILMHRGRLFDERSITSVQTPLF